MELTESSLQYLTWKIQIKLRDYASALSKPDKNTLTRFLSDAMPTLTTLSWIHNEGLLSIQELQFGTKDREDWENAIAKSNNILRNKSESLINSLGFQNTKLDNLTDLLTKDQEKSAIAILLNESEITDIATRRFNNISLLH